MNPLWHINPIKYHYLSEISEFEYFEQSRISAFALPTMILRIVIFLDVVNVWNQRMTKNDLQCYQMNTIYYNCFKWQMEVSSNRKCSNENNGIFVVQVWQNPQMSSYRILVNYTLVCTYDDICTENVWCGDMAHNLSKWKWKFIWKLLTEFVCNI